jgi:hypothetical protein
LALTLTQSDGGHRHFFQRLFLRDEFVSANGLFTDLATLICRPPTNIFINGLSNLTLCAPVARRQVLCDDHGDLTNCSPYSLSVAKRWRPPLRSDQQLPGDQQRFSERRGVYAVEVTSVCRTVTNSATLTVNTPW